MRVAIDSTVGGVADAVMDLARRESAFDALLAGVWVACALEPSVLLGPLQLIVGGVGHGLRALDACPLQPGREQPRPRGFREGVDAIAPAAWAAVPVLPAGVAVAAAAGGRVSTWALMGPALEVARERSAERARVLSRLGKEGPAAMVQGPLASELCAAFGRMEGGLLSEADLRLARPAWVDGEVERRNRVRVGRPPFAPQGSREASHRGSSGSGLSTDGLLAGRGRSEVIVAADARGVVAAAVFEVHDDGIALPALGLAMPRLGQPVLRGVPRVVAGTVLPRPCPIALVGTQPEIWECAAASSGQGAVEGALGKFLDELDAQSDWTATPGRVVRSDTDGRILAVHRTEDSAVLLR